MFGRPHWFRKREIGWGLVPITWQAWVYGVAWYGVIVLAWLLPHLEGQGRLGLLAAAGLTVLKLVDMKLIRDRMADSSG